MYDIKNLNIWKKEERKTTGLNGMSSVDITELNLSVRSYNCLKRAGCNTVGDILDLIDEEGNGLRRIRNLGSRSEAEIKEMLEGLKKEYAGRPVPAPVSPIKLVRPAGKTMERPIDDFGLSGKTRRRLEASGIRYVRDLYSPDIQEEPGWFAVRELFDRILNR